MRGLLLLATAALASAKSGGDNNGVVGNTLLSLDGDAWRLSNGSLSIPASVPGDLLTDLQSAGLIGDPLYELNFKGKLWDLANWTYTLSFTTQPLASSYLVFQGLKHVADVALNGQYLGYAADQFLRYTWDVSGVVRPGVNTLTVTFPTFSDPRNCEQRWMSCSGGWDWAP